MLLGFASQAFGQNWELGLTGGLTNYQGDLVEPTIDPGNGELSYGLFIQRNFNERFGARLGFNLGKFGADDKDYDRYVEGTNALVLNTSYSQLHLRLDYNLFRRYKNFYNANGEKLMVDQIMNDRTVLYDKDGQVLSSDVKRKRNWSPYVFAGLGMTFLNENLRQEDLEGINGLNEPQQELFRQEDDQPTSLFTTPIGGGINFFLGERTKLGFEAGFNPVFNDYLDGVSKLREEDNNDTYWTFLVKLSTSLAPKDTDGDGILDKNDKCPETPGVPELEGCPDMDGDGITDRADKCPETPGLRSLRGCPDQDGDGIADNEDDCPQLAGIEALKGCPDSDGDGVIDPEDNCPNDKGSAELAGCPDSDGDGIIDNRDDCPKVAGVAAFNGCPDSDGDGIADKDDKCPNKAGVLANGGCPEVKKEPKTMITKEDQKRLNFAMENIEFETNSAKLTSKSETIVAEVGSIMNKYPNLKIRISGHTDNQGNAEYNQKLSERRAQTCYTYLTNKSGINSSRLSYIGFGQTQPIATNDTAEGRRKNRRVEFNEVK